MNLRKLPVFKIIPQLTDFLEIAIVDEPAIDELFLKFGKEQEMVFNADKMIISGAVMIPNSLIYRNDNLGERFVTYDEDGVISAAQMFLKNGMKFNSQHTKEKFNIDVIESYITKEDNEFNVPKGSWIITAKVNDDVTWEMIKQNDLGFSFQAAFTNQLIGTKEINFKQEKKPMTIKEQLTAFIDNVLFKEEVVATEFAADVPAETPAEPVVEEAVQLTPEDVQAMIDASIESASVAILDAVKQLLDAQASAQMESFSAMNLKIEEFGKQPATTPEVETIENKLTMSNPAYAGLNLK